MVFSAIRWVCFCVLAFFGGHSASSAEPQQKSGLEMVFVGGGTFTMGGDDDVDDAGPPGGTDECPHLVTVSNFWIGKYEVTQADWMKFMGSNPSQFTNSTDNPVEMVSWEDAQLFIRTLNAATGKRFRLPTEAEWEFAGRAGIKNENFLYAGSDNAKAVAWYEDNSGARTHPVGLLQPNGLGIHDMSGNIWEWCLDYKIPYPCDPYGKRFDPDSTSFPARILRGGTWSNRASSVRVRDRNGRGSALRLPTLGFRLAMDSHVEP
jgi:formylglycine-generating enzyme required for sulfatase activity